MNQIIVDILVQIGAYITVMLIALFFMNWTTSGFLFPSLMCKLSRGRKTLVCVKSISGDYYKAGNIIEGMLNYKDSSNNKKQVPIESAEYISYIGGTKSVIVDEVKNAMLKADFSSATGFDAVKYENLYVRALTSPNLQDANLRFILIVSVVAALCAGACLWFVWLQGTEITETLELVKNLAVGI